MKKKKKKKRKKERERALTQTSGGHVVLVLLAAVAVTTVHAGLAGAVTILVTLQIQRANGVAVTGLTAGRGEAKEESLAGVAASARHPRLALALPSPGVARVVGGPHAVAVTRLATCMGKNKK
jgi:hypothetical protein